MSDAFLFDVEANRASDPFDTAEFATPTYEAGQAIDSATFEPDNVNGSGEPFDGADAIQRRGDQDYDNQPDLPRTRPLVVGTVPYPGRVVAAGSYTLVAGASQVIGFPVAAGAPSGGCQIILKSTTGALIRVIGEGLAASAMLGFALGSAAQPPLVLPVDRVTVKNQDLVTADDVFFIILAYDRLPE